MKEFTLVNAASIDEAVSIMQEKKSKAKIMAGGTDLLGCLKRNIYAEYPQVLINIQNIDDLSYIKEEDGYLKIGALTKLEAIAESPIVQEKYTALAQAAAKTASPHLRAMGTIGGNICQDTRCWYLRAGDDYFDCLKKGGRLCYAVAGDNRYHSIFGGARLPQLACQTECPSHIDIPAYMEKLRAGDIKAAAQILLRHNPLPAVTGRVCPHSCEAHCNRQEIDSAVSIREAERMVGDYILEHADELICAPDSETGKNVAVIGSGPAGLSAAFYLRRMGHHVAVIEAKKEAGGMLTYAIPTYRLPKDIVKKQVKALKAIGIEFNMGIRVGQDIQLDTLMTDYDAVFVATGAWQEKPTGIKGEELLISGLSWLSRVNSGDTKLPGQKVAVLGGGNTALDVARTLKRLGGQPLILYRRGREEMPAIAEDVEKAEAEGIEFQLLTQPVEIASCGDKINITCVKMELGAPDASGRRRPLAVAGSEYTLEFDAAITAFGEVADMSFIPAANKDADGWFTAAGQIFGGGDFVTGPATVTAAIGAGREIAGAIDKFLGGQGKKEASQCGYVNMCASFCYDETGRVSPCELGVAERVKSINVEDVSTLSPEVIRNESVRCLNCGCVAVNPSDTAPALVVLDAVIVTTKRRVPAEQFWAAGIPNSTVLEPGELVTEIQMPAPTAGAKSAFVKFATRATVDFPTVNCAVLTAGGEAKICLNAVAPNPYRAVKAEEAVKGKTIDESTAEAAGEAAVSDAVRLDNNKYKIQIAKVMVKRALLACT